MIPPEFMPMLCSPEAIDPDQLTAYDPGDWVADVKWDGWRAIVQRTETGVSLFNGRNGSDYTGKLPYLDEHLTGILPADTCVDGELISPLGHGAVQTAMRRNDPHRPSEGSPALMLVIFDILRLNGQTLTSWTWDQRRELVEKIQVERPYSAVSPVISSELSSVHMSTALSIALDNGFEGIVLKARSSRYVSGRSSLWRKCKPQQSLDAKVVGFSAGKAGGAWDGKVGAFEIELLDPDDNPTGIKTTIKCGTDERHEEATSHPERWLGMVVEIRHHGLGDTGVPRHPQYFRRREDKNQPIPRKLGGGRVDPRIEGKARMRNYRQMADEKLARCVQELRAGEGDAVNRCVSKGGDPAEDLKVAEAELEKRSVAA